MQRLRTAENRRQRLNRHSHDVVLGLLSREADAGGLRMEAHEPRPRILGAEGISHLVGPDASGGTVLSDLFKEAIMSIEKE